MLVYTQDSDSILINKGDDAKVDLPDLVFKVTRIIKQKFDNAPNLGLDFAIKTPTDFQSSGSFYPGGEIYIQKTFTAIIYSTSKIGFTFFYDTHPLAQNDEGQSLEVLPLNHTSTPFSRSIDKIPSAAIFVPNGTLTMYNDDYILGLDAERIFLYCGNLLAAFKVKGRMYDSMILDDEPTIEQLCTIEKLISDGDTQSMYTFAGPCEGFRYDASILNAGKNIRESLKDFQIPVINYDLFYGISEPPSIGDSLMATITSTLDMVTAVEFLSDRKLIVDDVSSAVNSLFLTHSDLEVLFSNDCLKPSVIETIYHLAEFWPNIGQVEADTDFRKLLEDYTNEYQLVKTQLARDAFNILKSERGSFYDKLNSSYKSTMSKYGPRMLSKVTGIASEHIRLDSVSGNFAPSRIDTSVIESKPVQEQANYWVTECEGLISKNGWLGKRAQNSDRDFAGLIQPEVNPNCDLIVTKVLGTLIATDMQADFGFLQGLQNIPISRDLGTTSGACHHLVYNAESRKCLGETINSRKAFASAGRTVVSVKDARGATGKLILTLTVSGFAAMEAKYWQNRRAEIKTLASIHVQNILRPILSSGGANKIEYTRISEETPGISHYDNKIVQPIYSTRHSVENLTVTLQVTITNSSFFNISGLPGFITRNNGGWVESADSITVRSLLLAPNPLEVGLPDFTAVDVDNLYSKGFYNIACVNSRISKAAADAAYHKVRPYLEALKQNYPSNPYGYVGNSLTGLPVPLNGLALIARLDVSYLEGIDELVREAVENDTSEGKTATRPIVLFNSDLQSMRESWSGRMPVLYYDRFMVMQAGKIFSKEVVSHVCFLKGD